ncbi:MAG: hypothetical protein WKG07_48250 [Hymenobacter sp.]
MRLLYGSESADLTELMGPVLGIEKHRLLLHDRRLAGRHLRLTLQEYRRGVPGPEKLLSTDNSLTRLDSAGRLAITIYARPVSAAQVENLFILPRVSMPKTFATLLSKTDTVHAVQPTIRRLTPCAVRPTRAGPPHATRPRSFAYPLAPPPSWPCTPCPTKKTASATTAAWPRAACPWPSGTVASKCRTLWCIGCGWSRREGAPLLDYRVTTITNSWLANTLAGEITGSSSGSRSP